MLLLIDNYDSFTYNLVHYLGELGADVEVHRNDALDVQQAMAFLKADDPYYLTLRAGQTGIAIRRRTSGLPDPHGGASE